MAGKLTEEKRQEIVRRYQSGESFRQVASSVRCNAKTAYRYVRAAGVVRTMSQSNILARPIDIHLVSRERWEEMYSSPGSGYPSIKELAQMALLQGNSGDQVDRWRNVAHAAGVAHRQAISAVGEAIDPPKRGRR